mgnify:CR=1 FL=1
MEFKEEKVLQKGVRLAKLSVDKALLKAKSHTKKGEIEEAQKLYQSVLQAFPKNKRAQQGLAALNIPKQPKDPQSPPQDAINQLIQLYNQGHLATIVEQAQTLTEQYPEAFIIWNILGAVNKGLGRVQAASEAFKKVTELNPAYADGFNNLGASLQDQGKLEEAIVSYNKALSLKPDYVDAYYNMGNALKVQGKLEEAIASFNKALSLKPNYADAYYNMGNALKVQGKLEEAIVSYNKALSIESDYAGAYNNMGNALKDQGKLEEAIASFNKALSIKSDYAEAIYNTIDLLKKYSPESVESPNLFNIDDKIKKLSPRILHATSDSEIIDNLAVGLNYLNEESFEYKTPLSQIYKRNEVDLKCKRHLKIFDTKDIIPEFCFGCFKVQVDLTTVIDLIKVTSLFYKIDFEEDLTRKTMIELRPNISGTYKGLIYCRGLDQAEVVKTLLDISLKEVFGEKNISKIKRGCSEYPIKFQNYGEIPKNPKDMMKFPKEWRLFEQEFDQNALIEPKETNMASLAEFCLSDFHIIQKWIDYAKGICDQSIEAFNDRPIIFTDIYEKAKIRTLS